MNIFNSKILTVPIFLFAAWMIFSVISVKTEERQVKGEKENLERRIDEVKRDNESIQGYLDNSNNPSFLDREARLRLNVKLPDEEVFFVYKDSNARPASASQESEADDLANWQKWWYYLLGR